MHIHIYPSPTLSEGQGSRNGFAEWFWLRVSGGFQCSCWPGLQPHLTRSSANFAHVTAGRGFSSSPCGSYNMVSPEWVMKGGERTQNGSRNVFYHLITKVTDHHFWHIPLIAQTSPDKCERGHTGPWMPGGRDHQSHLGCLLTQKRTAHFSVLDLSDCECVMFLYQFKS